MFQELNKLYDVLKKQKENMCNQLKFFKNIIMAHKKIVYLEVVCHIYCFRN